MRHYVFVPFAATLLGGASSPTSVERPALLSPAITAPADTLGDRLRRELGPWLDERARAGAFSGGIQYEHRRATNVEWNWRDRPNWRVQSAPVPMRC